MFVFEGLLKARLRVKNSNYRMVDSMEHFSLIRTLREYGNLV